MDSPIGLFDSGLGGLTVLRELRHALPGERFIYLGDTARTPYGSKGAETIRRYSHECAQFLLSHNIKLLIVACNTASSVALADLIEQCPCPVIGTIDPAVESALAATKNGRVAVLGTRATIESQAYQRKLSTLRPELRILARACPLFVPLVEEGITSGRVVDEALQLYLSDLRAAEVDTVILGCTHYPLLTDALRSFLGAEISLIECSKSIAAQAAHLLGAQGRQPAAQHPGEHYFVTDEVSRFNALAKLFASAEAIEAIHVEDLAGTCS